MLRRILLVCGVVSSVLYVVVDMLQVLIEVNSGFARIGVWAQAVSIRRAVGLVTAQFPDADVRVSFPIDPDGFFVKDPAARAGLIGREQPEQVET